MKQPLLDRYTAQNENFVLVVAPDAGAVLAVLGARSAPKGDRRTSQGHLIGIARARPWLVRALLAIPFLLVMTDPAFAQLGGILSRPVPSNGVITRSGSYLLERDMAATAARPAIRVLANDVTLDLDGHRLTGPGNRVGVGISIEGVSSVRVFNGRGARLGIGVRIQDSNNVTVDGVQIVGEDLGGPPPEIEIGILVVNSRAVVLTNNAISRVFLGIFIRGGGSGGNRIAMNTLTGDANGALGICYNPSPTPGASDGPQGDLVYGNLISRFGTGIATSAASIGNVFRGNTIAYFTAAVDEATPGSNVFEENAAVQITP